MKTKTFDFKKWVELIQKIAFPLILLLYPLCKINQGIELTDTAYSLGNYRFFEGAGGVWTMATFLSNLTGYFLTRLPFGETMLGMRFYTSLIVGGTALFAYRFFRTKMPPWIAFAGELTAIGLCWCPTVILYNYMTYLLFLMGAVFVFRGLAGNRPFFLVLAGICLGLNVSVRFPNVIQAGLILAVWYYGALKRKPFKQVAKETGLCFAGFAGGLLVMIGLITVFYGTGAFNTMVTGIFGMAGSASDYTLGEMLLSILDAYLHGFKWMLYMILCILPGIPFIMIWKDKFPVLRKSVYGICVVFLFIVLGKWGMYNFRYYQKEAALQWGAVFLILSIMVFLWMLFTRMIDKEWKLIGCIGLLIILITPLGSNNYIWPVLNNLFFIAPVSFWMIYRFVRWGRTYLDGTGNVPLFPVKAMVTGIIIAFSIQCLGVGFFYVFKDGEFGEVRDTKVLGNEVLEGMYTTGFNAETLEEISTFMQECKTEYAGKKLILYGDIPGLSYYLDKPPAVFTTWPDLDTNSLTQLENDLKLLGVKIKDQGEERPLVILTPQIAAYLEQNEEAIAWFGGDMKLLEDDKKLAVIGLFMSNNGYIEAFSNEAFVVYE